MVIWNKFKKILIWTLVTIFLSSIFIVNIPKTNATSNNATDLAGCTLITSEVSEIKYARVISFSSFNIPFSGTPITHEVSFYKPSEGTGSKTITYSFIFEKFDAVSLGGTTDAHGVYTYKNSEFPESKLVLDGGTGNIVEEINLGGGIPGIKNAEAGDQDYQDYASIFNEKRSNFSSSCTHSDLFGDGTFETEISFRCNEPPIIEIGGHGTRPATKFQLTAVLSKHGIAPNDVLFLFKYLKNSDGKVEAKFAHYYIKLFGVGGNAFLAECSDPNDYKSCAGHDYTKKVVTFKNDSLQLFWNHVYNSQDQSGIDVCGTVTVAHDCDPDDPSNDKNLANWTTKPNIQCLNASSNGWLAKWGIKVNDVSLTHQAGIEDDTCGITGLGLVAGSIAKVLCLFLRIIGQIGQWLIDGLGIGTVINAYQENKNLILSSLNFFSISQAADGIETTDTERIDKSSIKKALEGDPPWVLDAWRMVLGLANVFVVIILLFLAITNILRIQYDTYAIKKALPTLIIGIILANFSVLITKMLVDATNVITATFTGEDPGEMIKRVINNLIPESGQPGFVGNITTVGTLFLAIIFSILAIIALLVIGFLFYIRYIAILTLTVVAPLAFVLMAFPPTQGFFKQWWGWYAKFIFMKPISVFLIWLAFEVLQAGGQTNLTPWIIATLLLYAAFLVPLKMGGVIMGGWGRLGQWATGTKKEGYLRKPAEEWWGRRKEKAGAKLKTLPGISWLAWRQTRDKDLTEATKKESEGTIRQHARGDNKYAQAMARAENLEKTSKLLQTLQQYGIASGNYRPEFGLKQIRSQRGFNKAMKLQSQISNTAALLEQALKAIPKNESEAVLTELGQQMEDANRTNDVLKSNEFTILNDYEIDEKTNRIRKKPGKGNYDQLRKLSDQLTPMIDKEQDEKVKNGLIEDKKKINDEISDFEQNYRAMTGYSGENLNFAAYRNRNFLGRQLALLRPWVGEEAQTIMLSTDRAGFTKQFFGWYYDENGEKQFKDEIGGTGNIRNYGSKDMAEFTNQRMGNLDSLRRAANTILMVGYKQAMLTNTVDAQEKMCDFLEGMTGENYLGSDFLKNYLKDIESERGGTLKEFLNEYNARARNIDIPEISVDENNIDEMVDAIDIGAIRSIDPRGGPGTRAQSLLNNRIKAKIANDGRFLGGRNEALAIGDYSMPGETIHPPTGSTEPSPKPSPRTYSPDPNQAMAQYLTQATPEEIQKSRSQYKSSTDMAQQIFQPGTHYNPANFIRSMYAGLSQKLTQGMQDIDINSGVLNPLIDALANLDVDVNLDHDQLETQLKAANPNIPIKLDREMPVNEYIQEAKNVKTGRENLHTILDEAEVEQISPYAEAMANRNTERLEQLLDQLNGTMERFTAASEQAADKIEAGEKDVKIDPQAMKEMADTIKEVRGGDIPLNIDNYRDDPANLSDLAYTFKKAIVSALNYKQGTEQTPDQFKIAMKKAIQESQDQPTPPPPGGTQPPPAAPSGPGGATPPTQPPTEPGGTTGPIEEGQE